MPNGFQSSHVLPWMPDLPARDRQQAERAIRERNERRRKASAARARQAEDAAEGWQRALHDLVGVDNLRELREGIRRERLAFGDLWQPPQGPERDFRKHKRASRRKAHALLRRAGAAPDVLAEVGREFHAKLDQALAAPEGRLFPGYSLPGNLERWTRLSPLHKLPLPWRPLVPPDDPTDPHRWFLFQPPFWGFLFDFDPITSSNFRADHRGFLHPPSGLVGNEATMDCDDAGSFDYASVLAESQIALRFDAPVAGVVEVLVDAQSTMATHHLEIEDEFGFSEAWTRQTNHLMMDVLHPNVPEPSLALMSSAFEESDGDDVSFTREHLTRGQHYFAQLFSAGPVQGGESVIVTVGTRTFDKARANDMEVHSRTDFQWFINSVEVRIAP